jgi:hypothetical protein
MKVRERRQIASENNPDEINTLIKIIELLNVSNLHSLTFAFKKGEELVIEDSSLLDDIKGELLLSFDEIAVEDLNDLAKEKLLIRSNLISEDLDSFISSKCPEIDETMKGKFIMEFYDLAGRYLTQNAFLKRKSSKSGQ